MSESRKSRGAVPAAGKKGAKGFSAEEKAAMRAADRERRSSLDGESQVQESIAKMAEPDRTLAKRIHALVKKAAPELEPRTWYGMPAYAKGGNVVCFFQNAGKFKVRYSTLGFSDEASLDDGAMWPVAYALLELTPADEARIVDLVKQAATGGSGSA